MTYQSVPHHSPITPFGLVESLANALKNAARGVKETLDRRAMQRIDRDAFRHLLSLDDEMLADIGVNRADVEWASNLPLSFNASQELERLARGGDPDAIVRARPARRQ